MKRIASRTNPFFRRLRLLADDAAARRREQAALLEGIHLCDAFLESGGVPRAVVVGQACLGNAEVVDLLDRAAGADVHVLDEGLFAAISGLAHGVAFLMLIDLPGRLERPDIGVDAVLLDRVQDPGNVGSILRSAAAAGMADVYLSRECAGAWSPKVLRAAMGAHFHLRLFEDCDLASLQRGATVPLIATSPHAPRSLYDTDLRAPLAWLFGHEGQGVAPALMEAVSAVRIPQAGPVESLNVAASAAVCFFEQARQRIAR